MSDNKNVQPPTRGHIAEHRWVYIFQERPNELSMRCTCGWLWKHLPMDHMRSVTLPRCPDEQPTPRAEPVQYNGHNGLAVFADAARRLSEGQAVPTAEPVSIAEMAPGTRFVGRTRDGALSTMDRVWMVGDIGYVFSTGNHLLTADRIDPSTIRDVTPPPATPEEGDRD